MILRKSDFSAKSKVRHLQRESHADVGLWACGLIRLHYEGRLAAETRNSKLKTSITAPLFVSPPTRLLPPSSHRYPRFCELHLQVRELHAHL